MKTLETEVLIIVAYWLSISHSMAYFKSVTLISKQERKISRVSGIAHYLNIL